MNTVIEPIPPAELLPEKRQGPFLIAGLGNPGRQYENNRHNVGFMLLNRMALKLEVRFGQVQSRSLVAKTSCFGARVILIKPQTYMNESGKAVSSLVRFYKVPMENLLV